MFIPYKPPQIIVLEIGSLNTYIAQLESDEDFPIIDTQALMSVIIDFSTQCPDMSSQELLHELLNSEYVSDRLDLDQAYCEKLASILYNLIKTVNQTLNEIKLHCVPDTVYRYKSNRSDNLVLLQQC
jgi:hypothetical protein